MFCATQRRHRQGERTGMKYFAAASFLFWTVISGLPAFINTLHPEWQPLHSILAVLWLILYRLECYFQRKS